MNPKPRLNLFALPSQTTLIFGGILIVIGLPLLLSLTGRFALLLPLMPIVVLLFALWDFLAEPVRTRAAYQAKPLGGAAGETANSAARSLDLSEAEQKQQRQREEWLVKRASAIAHEIHVQPPPILLKTHRPLDYPLAFGAWRQRYLLLPADLIPVLYRQAGDLNPQKARYTDVILHHELAHFANHDVAFTFFARSLLRQTVFVLFAYWLALLWVPFLYQTGLRYAPEFAASLPPDLLALLPALVSLLAPAELQATLPADVFDLLRSLPQLTWQMMVIYWIELTMAVMPLVGGAIFLYLRDWNLLLRVRELYADARANAWMGHLAPLIADAHGWLRTSSYTMRQVAAGSSAPGERRSVFSRLRLPRPQPLAWPDGAVGSALLPKMQPSIVRRKDVLAQPQLVYGTAADIGRRAGVIVLLLFLITGSLLAPAQEGIGSEIGIGVGFLVLAAGLTPSAIVHLPDDRAIRRDRWRAVGFYMLVFNSALLVVLAIAFIGVLVRPADLDLVMYAIAGALPSPAAPLINVIDDPLAYIVQAVLGSLLIYFVGAPLLLYGSLTVDFWLKRRVLHWYDAGWLAQRSDWVLLLISVVLAAILWLGIAPLLHMAAFPLIIGWDWGYAAGLGIAGLCALFLALWLRRNDRRYRNRCPNCGCAVEVSYHLGLHCPHCGEALQPWLAARE